MCAFCKQSKDFHSNHNHSCSYYLLILQQSDFLQGNIKMLQDFKVCINADNCRLSWLPGIMQKHSFFFILFLFLSSICKYHVAYLYDSILIFFILKRAQWKHILKQNSGSIVMFHIDQWNLSLKRRNCKCHHYKISTWEFVNLFIFRVKICTYINHCYFYCHSDDRIRVLDFMS